MQWLRRLFGDSKVVVHALVCVFAISSWVDLNGMWVELPILVSQLPEQWTLPSYITVIGQVANIGPIIFLIIAYCLAKTTVPKLTLDKVTSYLIMLVGVASTLLLAFLWKRTEYFWGSERSVALLTLSFFLCVMDCTSSVAYVAFMAALRPVYLSSFFIGEGLSGLLPALLALAQGAGDIVCVNGSSTEEQNVSGVLVNVTTYSVYPEYIPPRFSVQIFFLLLSALILLSATAFCLLNNWRYCRNEFVSESSYDLEASVAKESRRSPETAKGVGVSNPAMTSDSGVCKAGVSEFTSISSSGSRSGSGSSYGSRDSVTPLAGGGGSGGEGERKDEGEEKKRELSTATMVLLLGVVVVVNLLITSFLLSLQTYSSLPYGISNYNLVVTLTNIANPVACFVSLFLAASSPLAIAALASVGVACGAYIIVAASMSPEPPLVDQSAGGPLMVVVWVTASFFLTYAKVSVAGVMRHVGRRALLWYGVATQCGSLIGAVTGFVLVNDVKVFRDASWC